MPLNKKSLTYSPPGITPPANMYNYSAPSGDSSEFAEYTPGRKAPVSQHQVSSPTPLTPQQVRAFLAERNISGSTGSPTTQNSTARNTTAPTQVRPRRTPAMTNPVNRTRRAKQI